MTNKITEYIETFTHVHRLDNNSNFLKLAVVKDEQYILSNYPPHVSSVRALVHETPNEQGIDEK